MLALDAASLDFDRALVVVAHPDDAEFYCGGALALLARRGVQVSLLVCTRGDRGGLEVREDGPSLAERRRREQQAAAAILGLADMTMLDHADGELVDGEPLRREIVAAIRRVRPAALFAHDPAPYYQRVGSFTYLHHTDHRAAGQAALAAAFPRAAMPTFYPDLLEPATAGLRPHAVRQVLIFDTPHPDCSVDIGETLDTKLAALAAHESQGWVWGGQVEVARRMAEEAGRAAGCPYAECFKRLVLSF